MAALAVLISCALPVRAEDPPAPSETAAGPFVRDALTGVALGGYDAVSYFTESEPSSRRS